MMPNRWQFKNTYGWRRETELNMAQRLSDVWCASAVRKLLEKFLLFHSAFTQQTEEHSIAEARTYNFQFHNFKAIEKFFCWSARLALHTKFVKCKLKKNIYFFFGKSHSALLSYVFVQDGKLYRLFAPQTSTRKTFALEIPRYLYNSVFLFFVLDDIISIY